MVEQSCNFSLCDAGVSFLCERVLSKLRRGDGVEQFSPDGRGGRRWICLAQGRRAAVGCESPAKSQACAKLARAGTSVFGFCVQVKFFCFTPFATLKK